MPQRRPSAVLAGGAAALFLLLAACSDDGDRPTVDELSAQIEEEGAADGVTAEQADCIASAFVDSDISDEGLDTIAENPEVDDVADLDLSDDDKAAATAAIAEVTQCVLGDVELPEDTSTTAGG